MTTACSTAVPLTYKAQNELILAAVLECFYGAVNGLLRCVACVLEVPKCDSLDATDVLSAEVKPTK